MLYSGQLKKKEARHENTRLWDSDQVKHKPGCIATDDGKMLKISDLGSRVIVLGPTQTGLYCLLQMMSRCLKFRI